MLSNKVSNKDISTPEGSLDRRSGEKITTHSQYFGI